MEEILNHIEGVEIILDDILIYDIPENSGVIVHTKALIQVMEAARENNIIFKIKKLKVCRSEVEYIGPLLEV